MSALADKIRAARKLEIKVDEFTFTGTRATVEQALQYHNHLGTITDAEICRRHITGWQGVKESDICEGGQNKDIDFNKDTFNEIIGEKVEWFFPIAKFIVADAVKRLEEQQNNKKK